MPFLFSHIEQYTDNIQGVGLVRVTNEFMLSAQSQQWKVSERPG